MYLLDEMNSEGYVLATDIGTKNNHGDIVEITTLKYKVIYEAYI